MKTKDVDLIALEQKMLSPEEWDRVPHWLIDMFHEEIETGYPVGFAYDEELGWCCLMTGQGPFLAFSEHGDD